jgi:conjugative relaxase-like TrwC/TraI family protein
MMRVTTLKASGGGVGGLLDYYCGLAEGVGPTVGRGPADYYLDPDEPAGRWWGAGCSALGLEGEVGAEQLRALLEAQHPESGTGLGRPFADSSVRGFDATFSAPKSVSVLWALAEDPWVRAEVLAAHDSAVTAALGWFGQHGCVTRRAHDGVHQVDAEGITAALFRQHTSRTVDPQLHTHALISSKVQDVTSRWLALDARFLKYQQRTIGWVYDAALRCELTSRLGLEWGDMVGGQAELVKVPADAREVFSQRSAQVAAKRDELVARWMVEHDGLEPDRITIARLERSAVLASRPAKRHGLSGADLHDTWRAQAAELGLDLGSLSTGSLSMGSTTTGTVDPRAVAREALRRVAEESSTWLVADLARHVATLVPADAALSSAALVAEIDRIAAIAAEQCVDLTPERTGPTRADGRPVLEHVTDRRLTTPIVLEQERWLQDWALSHAHRPGPAPDAQVAASEAMAGTRSLVIVVGPAGTGKTRATAEAVGSLQRQGRSVVGLAPSGKAADVLGAEAGCPTDTVAGFLTRHRGHPASSQWPPGTTVLLDEAGMAATADLAELVGLVRRNYWRLVAIGDPAQLPSVGRGGAFAHWCETVPHHELEAPRRFQEPWEAQASLGLRTGDQAVVRQDEEHGRLHATHPALLPHRIADMHQQAIEAGRTVAITTGSQDMASAINAAIQDRSARPADEPRRRLADGSHLYVGDVVATRRNDPSLVTDLGSGVRSRQLWSVQSIGAEGSVVVADAERGRAVLPPAYVADHVELGWAVTGYGNQGDTVDVGIAAVEPGTTRNHLYVAMTRGRESNHAWTADDTGGREAAGLVRNVLANGTDRVSALGVAARLQREAAPTALARSSPEQDLSLGPGG